MIEARADLHDMFVAEVHAGIGVTSLGIERVVRDAGARAQRVARSGRAESLKDRAAVFEVAAGEVTLGLEAGVAADDRLRRSALRKGVRAVIERQQRAGA